MATPAKPSKPSGGAKPASGKPFGGKKAPPFGGGKKPK